MKIFVISDIHGSYKYLKKFLNIYNEENGELLIILGDILYHGPRNPLPEEYNPKKVIELLNQYKNEIMWIKGNCDGEVDEMVLDFNVADSGMMLINNHKIYLTHGHKKNELNMNLSKGDILLYGHLHVNFIKEENDAIIANPGSLSLPKNNTKNSYMVIDDSSIVIYSLEKEKLFSKKI